MNASSADLAIVIPAFKARYFATALESLCEQTDQSFTVYVGDDASPEALKDIVDAYAPRLRIRYHRFEKNLGEYSLVGHWHRCIALCHEPWIWLFSDDDLAAPDCVSAFRRELRTRGPTVDLYRFNLAVIDDRGVEVLRPAQHPPVESAEELLIAILSNRLRQWKAPDHVFSRGAFERWQGFQEFPAGLFSDFATWIKFAHPRGVRTLPTGLLHWRLHDRSISSQTGAYRAEYFEALKAFCAWLAAWTNAAYPSMNERVRQHSRAWFFKQIAVLCGRLSLAETRDVFAYARLNWPGNTMALARNFLETWLKPRLRSVELISHWVAWRHERATRRYQQALR